MHGRALEKNELLLVRPDVCAWLRARVCTRAFACVRECVRDLRMGVTGRGADVAAAVFGNPLAAQCKVTPSTCHAARSVHLSRRRQRPPVVMRRLRCALWQKENAQLRRTLNGMFSVSELPPE